MSVHVEKRREPVESSHDESQLLHTYRCWGDPPPKVGDKALCGFVKVDPRVWEDGLDPREFGTCVVCEDLWNAGVRP